MRTEKVVFDKMDITIHYLIGENAKDNFAVIDEALKTDIWIHAEKVSSCHVVALFQDPSRKFNAREFSEIVKKGAELCKFYTNKLRMLTKKITFIYTEIQHVTKTKTAGLVIATHTGTISV